MAAGCESGAILSVTIQNITPVIPCAWYKSEVCTMAIILVEDKMKNESSLSDKNYNKISDH